MQTTLLWKLFPEDQAKAPVAIETPVQRKMKSKQGTVMFIILVDPQEVLCTGFNKLNGSRHLCDMLGIHYFVNFTSLFW